MRRHTFDEHCRGGFPPSRERGYRTLKTEPRTLTPSLSVIIPVAPGETAWRQLLDDLAPLDAGHELVLSATEPPPNDLANTAARRWLVAPVGRARQMNAGAASARGEFFWFLHADTRLKPSALDALFRSIDRFPNDLHYFSLRFLNDGPRAMFLNAWGARWRSRWLGMPFGDQGLCLRADRFRELGGFDESLPCAEDHALVQFARRRGLRLRCTGAAIATSARKYREHGWWRTTRRHLGFTLRKLIRRREPAP